MFYKHILLLMCSSYYLHAGMVQLFPFFCSMAKQNDFKNSVYDLSRNFS